MTSLFAADQIVDAVRAVVFRMQFIRCQMKRLSRPADLFVLSYVQSEFAVKDQCLRLEGMRMVTEESIRLPLHRHEFLETFFGQHLQKIIAFHGTHHSFISET
jgi:hypothetical protein